MKTELINKYHIALFPEEYDFCYDSIADLSDRKKGLNPMSSEYQRVVDSRRLFLGFEAFGRGLSGTSATHDWVREKVEKSRFKEMDCIISRFGLDPVDRSAE